MEKAAEEARDGNIAYFQGLDVDRLELYINQLDEDGRSLLHAAASSGKVELVDFLAERGAAQFINVGDEEVKRPKKFIAYANCLGAPLSG